MWSSTGAAAAATKPDEEVAVFDRERDTQTGKDWVKLAGCAPPAEADFSRCYPFRCVAD